MNGVTTFISISLNICQNKARTSLSKCVLTHLFWKYGQEVFPFCTRAGLTEVKTKAKDFVGWKGTSVFPAPDSLLRRGWHSEGPAELMWTSRHTNQRGHGSAAGVGKMGAVKWKKKTAEKRTVWVKSTKVSYSEHTLTRKVMKVGVSFIILPPPLCQRVFVCRRGEFRTQKPQWSDQISLRKPPLVSRGDWTDRAQVCCCYRRLFRQEKKKNFMEWVNSCKWCAQRWRAELWMTCERGGVGSEGIISGAQRHTCDDRCFIWDNFSGKGCGIVVVLCHVRAARNLICRSAHAVCTRPRLLR